MDASPVSSKPDVSREEFRELLQEVCDLRTRVSALEHHPPRPVAEAPAIAVPELHVSSDTVPAIGRALLAIAGAYLLRALTEMSLWPATVGVAAGILYAGFWLWHGARAKGNLVATINALSAVIIFTPLLWEATVRLNALSTWTAAGLAAVFGLAAIRIPRVALWSSTAGAAIALALMTATHDLLPFSLALVAIGAGAEFAAIRTNWFTALCADAGVLILIVMVGRRGGLPDGYAPVSLRATMAILALLFAVFAGSAVWRTLIRRQTFTIRGIAQTCAAFALGVGGALYLTRAALPIGMFTIIAGAACYAIAIGINAPPRNRHVYATFGALLLTGGAFLLFSGVPLIAIWSAMAIGICWTAFGRIHAPAFLWLAAVVSGVAASTASQLFADGSTPSPLRAAAIVLISAAICYLKLSRTADPWPALFVATAFLWTAAGVAASQGAGAVALLLFAVLLAWSGARWRKPELTWLMYAAMTLAAAKILFRDFSRENTMTLVVSLLFYGATLILLPRILRKRRGEPAGTNLID